MRRFGGLALALVTLGAWFVLFRPIFLGGDTAYILVAGHSMQPAFWTGDLAVLHKHRVYRKGDVVAYRANGGVIIHRIVGGDARKGYTVKGDNREYPDSWRPTPENIVGSVWLRVPKVGLAVAVARERRNLPVVAALLGFLAVLTAGGKGSWSLRALRREP